MSSGQAKTNDTAAPGRFGARILELADRLAQWSETPNALTCTYLTPTHRAVAAQLQEWMQAAGMRVEIDAVGNVVGRYAASSMDTKTLIVGSHYDTVRNAGKYDGRLGILAPLVVIEQFARTGRKLPFHLELIAFAEEEGVRFGTSYIGSSAVAGRFDMGILERKDTGGTTVGDLIRSAGGDPNAIAKLARQPKNLLGYLEIHIEQGPVLLRDNLPVGIVSAIAGGVRRLVTVTGVAGHAGTVPMRQRHDAVVAAAEIVLFVEKRCMHVPGLVGTVGQMTVPNGAINVIPGRCDLSIDIRADDTAKRDAAIDDVFAEIARIEERRAVKIESIEVQRTRAVSCSGRLQQRLADAVAREGVRAHYLPSGAGHDAIMFDGITDTAMLFVRCGNGGVSHSPMETITEGDADIAARVLLDVLLNFEK